ncbi:MAG TPA: sigma-70 family RNA polymerase sigma factor [Spirillospora sp.]
MSGWPSLDRADDERLTYDLAEGDPSALIQVMDRYAARLYDYCHALLRDQEQAAAALHDALVAAYAHVPGLRDPHRFGAWLYALVRRECMRRLRDPNRPAERHEAPEAEEGFLDDAELARRDEARRLVHTSLAALRGREREAMDLMLRHGLDPADIAGVLGMDVQEAADFTGRAHARLDAALTAACLVRDGMECRDAAALAAGGGDQLPPPVIRELAAHAETCEICASRRDPNLSAAGLLQVMPVAMMPTDLRGRVMATVTDPALASDVEYIAHQAGPFDEWGWPVNDDKAAGAKTSSGKRGPRALWPVLAAAAAVVVIVAGAFYLRPGSSGDRTDAQGSPSPSTSAPGSSEPSETEEPTESPTPTQSSPTPTPSTTTATPTPTRTRRQASRSSRPRPSLTRPRTGTLLVGGCTIRGVGPGSCGLPIQAVGGTVTWSVTGTSGGLSAGGGGTLASGQRAVVTVSGNCVPPGGAGTVSFSTGQSGTVTLECDEDDDRGGPGRRG